MKRMIINLAQLKAINEAAITTYDTPNLGSALNTFSTNVQQKNIPALVNVQSGQDNPNAKSLTVKTDNGQVEQDALAGQADGSVKDITFTPMNETRYSKRQVELGRILEMRRTGKVYSKKQLNEMFMETQEYEKRFDGIGRCMPWDVFDAVEEIFGPEARQKVDSCVSGDPKACIRELFMAADTDTQEEFLDRLGL